MGHINNNVFLFPDLIQLVFKVSKWEKSKTRIKLFVIYLGFLRSLLWMIFQNITAFYCFHGNAHSIKSLSTKCLPCNPSPHYIKKSNKHWFTVTHNNTILICQTPSNVSDFTIRTFFKDLYLHAFIQNLSSKFFKFTEKDWQKEQEHTY